MSAIDHLLNEPCTIQARTGVANEYGDLVLGPSGPPVAAAGYLEQQSTVEYQEDRETTVTKWVAYLPSTTTIARFSFINFQGATFEVAGEPEHCYNPRTQVVSHIRCNLTEVS